MRKEKLEVDQVWAEDSFNKTYVIVYSSFTQPWFLERIRPKVPFKHSVYVKNYYFSVQYL